nr:MAG TPA: hypothetical protein [Caudoviricetes sp.]
MAARIISTSFSQKPQKESRLRFLFGLQKQNGN